MRTPLQKHVVISVLGNADAFDDLVVPLYHSLCRLGYVCRIVRNGFWQKATNIVINLSDFPDLDVAQLPEDCIIYNMEQLVAGSKGVTPGYLAACARLPVWDYSQANVDRFAQRYGITGVRYVPLGYCPEMTRLDPDYPKDIDVLLYGSLNARRLAVVNALRTAGVNAMALYNVFGLERDILIARSRLVLNLHYYVPGIQEIIRLGYLWANSKCVVCERNADTSVPAGYDNCCVYAPYAQIADSVRQLLQRPQAMQAMGRAAFLQFRQHDFTAILEAEVGTAPGKGTETHFLPLPTTLNAGSGKHFLPNALNVDIEPRWNPDIVLDISVPLEYGIPHATARFGPVVFHKDMFQRIRLFDVLKHVADVGVTMTNLLELLCEGGELHVNVPYELSLGAWQDPTHRHAFNENSWLYYTEWHWYMGWREARFDLVDCSYILSPLGKTLERDGRDMPTILHTPRAVDAMKVRLRKRATTFDEKLIYDRQTRAVFTAPCQDWSAKAYAREDENISTLLRYRREHAPAGADHLGGKGRSAKTVVDIEHSDPRGAGAEHGVEGGTATHTHTVAHGGGNSKDGTGHEPC